MQRRATSTGSPFFCLAEPPQRVSLSRSIGSGAIWWLCFGLIMLPAVSAFGATWNTPKDDGCILMGVHRYAAIITGDKPRSMTWERACKTTRHPVYGFPARCVNRLGRVWGEFNVPDSACAPRWGNLKRDACTGRQTRQFSSIITGSLPPGFSWETACRATAHPVEGVPARCKKDWQGRWWGEFNVHEPNCGVTATEARLNTTVTVKPSAAGPLFGIADVHAHPFAQLGFGEKLFFGDTFNRTGLKAALGWCTRAHGVGGVNLLGTILDGEAGHRVGGYPEFDGWPRWNSSQHQQMYYKWIERAYRGGLRLQVMLAVSNQTLCQVYGKADQVRSCQDMPAVARIRALGGLQAPILHQGNVNEIRRYGTKVAHDCDQSSKSWAQVYQYAVAHTGNAVPLGTDFGGLLHQPAPRFGPDACAGNQGQRARQTSPVRYPFKAHGVRGMFDKLQTGNRTFDYNYDGLANIGLLPDFIEDLKQVGLGDRDLKPLFDSAEGFVAMWERIDAKERRTTTAFQRIQNRWKPQHYLHNEHGRIEVGPIQPGWWSAQWRLESQ